MNLSRAAYGKQSEVSKADSFKVKVLRVPLYGLIKRRVVRAWPIFDDFICNRAKSRPQLLRKNVTTVINDSGSDREDAEATSNVRQCLK
jgi:hypothetical protein